LVHVKVSVVLATGSTFIFSFNPTFEINNPLFLISDFQQIIIMNSFEFKEIIVFKDFEIENGVSGLEGDVYLSIVKFLDSSILRNV
jgi:hypothetical protein